MNKPSLYGLAVVLLLTISAPAAAGDIGVQIEFTDKEISTIRAYYQDHKTPHAGKKNGKGKKSLPPGIAKNLQRGKPLPPGIAKQILPAGLTSVLPPVPRGYDRIIVDGKILLIEVATQVIHDVLEDIILG